MIEDLLEFIEGPARWTVTAIALMVFLFLVARRKSSRRKLFEGPAKQTDIILNWGDKPGGQIPVEPWMETPEIKAVFSAITKNGKEARFIGGCVRDALLKKTVTDVDIATQETPDQVTSLLEEAGIKAVPVGIEHGTVMAVINHQSFEITTLRRDLKTDGRHAEVEFTDDWRQDAARRDFTFNTLSATPDGMVYDYFNGIQDLADRVIRFVGLAPERIEEDRLRVLRYFRFIATLGMRVESKMEFQACIDRASSLKELSAERIKAELFKILDSAMQLDVVALMYNHGVLKVILPHVTAPERLRQLVWLETSAIKFESVRPDPLRRLAALVNTDERGAADITTALKLSNAEQQRLSSLITPEWDADWQITDDDLRAVLYRVGAATVIDLALLKWAEMLVASPTGLGEVQDSWVRIIETADQALSETVITFPLKGQDVLDQGVEPGPKVSDLLGQVEDWWLADGCTADREACLTKLEALL